MIFPEQTACAEKGRRALRACVTVLVLLAAVAVYAQETAPPAAESERIQISADHLAVNNKDQSAVFSGNVTAVQGATRITADRLTVFYEAADTGAGAQSGTDDAIKRIVSDGNVTIRFDDKVAVTRKAIYNKGTGILELIGEDTRVTSGLNTITGNRISVDRTRDSITVEGGGSQRVEAVIFPGQSDGGGLLPPAPPPTPKGQSTP